MAEFQINDIVLNIPPEQIHVDRRSVNHQWQTLRTRSSIKVKSGFSQINITCNARFTDTPGPDFEDGYQKLQALVAQFRVTPFCYVENTFLRDSIMGGDQTRSMALALRQLEVRKIANDTNVLEATFTFSWFNYTPYSRKFTYKEDIFIPNEKRDPRESLAWKRMYRAELNRGGYELPFTLGTGRSPTTQAEFSQFALMPANRYTKLKRELKTLRELRTLFENRPADTSLDLEGLRAHLSKTLGEEDGKDVSDALLQQATSMFSDSDASSSETILRALSQTGISDIVRPRYNIDIADGDWNPVLTKDGELFRLKSDPVVLKKEKEQNKDRIMLTRRKRLNFDDEDLIVTGISISFENILATMPMLGHQYPTYQHIGSVDAVISLSIMTTHDESIQVLSEFYSAIEDQALKFRQVPQGQRNINLTNEMVQMFGLREFLPESLIIDTVPGQPGTFAATLVLVDNPITSTTAEAIVPGQSFTTTADIRDRISEIMIRNLRLVDNPEQSGPSLSGFFKSVFSLSPRVERSLKEPEYEKIEVEVTRAGRGGLQRGKEFRFRKTAEGETGYYIYAPQSGTGGARDERFRQLCQQYGAELGKMWIELFKSVIDAERNKADNTIAEMFSLTNADIYGIERVQEDLMPVLKNSSRDLHSTLRGSKLVTKDLAMLRKTSKDQIEGIEREVTAQFQAAQRARDKNLADDKVWASLQDEYKDWANKTSRFINSHLKDWLMFSTDFLDKIILSGALELPQFKEVRDMTLSVDLPFSGNAYPDFPLKQVKEEIEQQDGADWRQLREMAERLQLANRRLGPDALINPDFYFFNNMDSVTDLMPQHIIDEAKNAIITSQRDMRPSAEKSWVEGAYAEKILGRRKFNRINDRMTETTEQDPTFWADKEGDVATSVRDEMLRLTRSAQVFHMDDLQGEDTTCTHAAAFEQNLPSDSAIHVKAIDDELDQDLSTGARREATTMAPPDRYAECKHRFGVEAVEFASQQSLYPRTPGDPTTTPFWSWPTSDKLSTKISSVFGVVRSFGGQPHKGIDIIAVPGHPQKTFELNVLAAARGKVSAVTKSFDQSSNEFFRDITTRKDPLVGNSERVPKPKENTIAITLDHGGGWKTTYKHLQWDDIIQLFSKRFHTGEEVFVEMGDVIGTVGDTGYSTGAHLHFATVFNGVNLDPERVLSGEFNKVPGPTGDVAPSGESLLTRSLDQLEKSLHNGQGYSMARAYPTFKLYFIESDLGERKRFGFDDFFSYSSIKDIQVIRSRKIAADLCVIQMTNISGVLSNRKFRNGIDPDKPRDAAGDIAQESTRSPQRKNTVNENPIASLLLQPGVQLQLRLGYSNNPDELESLFNGVITDVAFSESDDLVEITCQSFAIEMTQNTHGEAKSFGGFLSSGGRTGAILEELMALPEMVHFGRWEPGTAPNNSVRSLLTNRWNFTPQPQDDNIFAPAGRGLKGIFDSSAKYIMHETTVWDVFQEMCLRHPSYVAYPLPYKGKFGPRMTMFFGSPEQLYFARDPDHKEDSTLDGLKKFIKEASDNVQNSRSAVDRITDPSASSTQPSVRTALNQQETLAAKTAREFWQKKMTRQFALDKGIIKPFRSYHLLTSSLHIMHNSIISSSSDTFNTATVQFKKEYGLLAKAANFSTAGLFKWLAGERDSFTLKCDAALPDEDVRELFINYDNCAGYEMAKRYSVSLLFQALKEGYRGSIISIGNAEIKPYDICYVFDEYTDMFGPIEVEQVVHRFSQQHGFITEVTPDMVVHVNQLSSMSTMDCVSLMTEHAMKKMDMQSLPSIMKSQANTASAILEYSMAPLANMFWNNDANALGAGQSTNPFKFVGAFLFRKLLTRSQLGHPFRYSPLVKDGKPMLGGLPNKKTDGSFIQGIKTWAKEADEGIPLLLEDTYDKLNPSNWVGYSQGNFLVSALGLNDE